MTEKIAQGLPCFIDTNVWLYAFIQSQDERKTALAKATIQKSVTIIISTQVINEVCVNLIKKLGFKETEIQNIITAFYMKYHVVELDQNTLRKASELRTEHGLSFWDSMIAASALASGAAVLYTEDMHDGFLIDRRLRIENPFK